MKKSDIRDWLDRGRAPLDSELIHGVPAPDTHEREETLTFIDETSDVEERLSPVTMRLRSPKAYARYNTLYRFLAVVACAVLIAGLIAVCLSFPETATSPLESEVSRFYNENTLEKTGSVNVVCGIILNFRGFDTLGESFVLFLAMNTVLLLLDGIVPSKDDPREELPGPRNIVPRTVAVLLVPLLLVFGVYIVINGHLSPGGGFSGGAVIGASMILFASCMGFDRADRLFGIKTFKVLTTSALSFYALSKLYHFLTEANRWPGIISNGTPGRIFSAGLLLPLDICVGIVVACTMYGLFCLFRRGRI